MLFVWFAVVHISYGQAGDEAYWDLVTDSLALFEQEDVSAAELGQLSERWNAIETLPMGTEERQLRPEIIAGQLALSEGSAEDLEKLRAMFLALQATRETWPSLSQEEGTLSIESANDRLDRLLADERYLYEEETENRVQAWLRRLNDRWNEWWAGNGEGDGLLSDNPLVLENPDPATGLLGIIAAVTLGFILFNLMRGVSFGLMRESARLSDHESEFDRPLTAKEAMEQAESTAESGDYRRSVRYLYLSTLLVLEEKGVFKYDRSLTNREYLEATQRYPAVNRLLGEVVDVFDRVWYGSAQIDAATLQQYQERIQKLQDAQESEDA